MGMEIIKAATITRPADTTAYAAGDLVANSTTAGSVTPFIFRAGGTPIRLRRIRMLSSNNTVTNKSYQFFLFSQAPTVTNGDNGAMVVTAADAAACVAVFASTLATNTGAGSINFFYPMDGAAVATAGVTDTIIPSNCWGLLRANAAYTPTSGETFDVWLEGMTDGLG